jgi:hypothetical protein
MAACLGKPKQDGGRELLAMTANYTGENGDGKKNKKT